MTRTQYQGGQSPSFSSHESDGNLGAVQALSSALLHQTTDNNNEQDEWGSSALSPGNTILSTFGPAGRGYFADKIFQVL